MSNPPRTHAAIVTVARRAPLELHQVPTPTPKGNEVLVRTQWVSPGPLELHQADGGLLVEYPHVLGGSLSGVVEELGPDVRGFKVGDKVFGYGWRSPPEKAHQSLSLLPSNLLGLVPPSVPLSIAATIPTNFVTAFHVLTADLHLALPWPKPSSSWAPPPHLADANILVWGASSSVGQYTLQVLRYYGYGSLIGVCSARNHALASSLGAEKTLDYAAPSLDAEIAALGPVPYVVDCIGSLAGSVAPIARMVARKGATVAVMLPVIVREATETEQPEYGMDVLEVSKGAGVEWEEGVEVKGTRTHFYTDNEVWREKLQGEVMPALVGEGGGIRPGRVRVVEGEGMLGRAEKALGMLRRKEVSGEKLVWRVD